MMNEDLAFSEFSRRIDSPTRRLYRNEKKPASPRKLNTRGTLLRDSMTTLAGGLSPTIAMQSINYKSITALRPHAVQKT